jgi:hypothetical protein
MSLNDLKIYTFNILALAFSFSNVEIILKIILLLSSIVYTILKTIELLKNKNKEKDL